MNLNPNPNANISNFQLHKLISMRADVIALENRIEAVMASAISEALEIAGSKVCPKGKKVFESNKGKIVLVLRKRYNPKDKVVMRLDEDIKAEMLRLAQKNAEAIAIVNTQIQQLKAGIEALEAKREKLLTSGYLCRLRKHEKIAIEESSYLVPGLSVFLNK